jgi:hypothetical protein
MNGLPYFKFIADEWLSGDITLEDFRLQGVFISVCAYYWKRQCDVDIAKLNLRYRGAIEEALDRLIDAELIDVDDDGKVIIKFLDEQYAELSKKHNTNKANGLKGAKKRWAGHSEANRGANSHAIALKKQKQIQKQNIKEKITKKEKMTIPPSLEEVTEYVKEKGSPVDPVMFVNFYGAKDWMIGKNKMKDWKKAVATWERGRSSGQKVEVDTSKYANISDRSEAERNF